MIYVTDLKGNRMEVRDIHGWIKQIEVLTADGCLMKDETDYWQHLYNVLLNVIERSVSNVLSD